MRFLTIVITGTLLAACVGCESPAPKGMPQQVSDSAPAPPEPAAPAEPAEPAEGAAADAAADQPADGEPAADATAPAADESGAAPAEPADDELTKAEVGVGAKGKDYGGPGFITTPVATMFRLEERIDFEAQIPNAMKIYKASHNNKGPKTHEEFMEVIIKEHGVRLPDLPAGSTYWYNAETEELMVRTPKTE